MILIATLTRPFAYCKIIIIITLQQFHRYFQCQLVHKVYLSQAVESDQLRKVPLAEEAWYNQTWTSCRLLRHLHVELLSKLVFVKREDVPVELLFIEREIINCKIKLHTGQGRNNFTFGTVHLTLFNTRFNKFEAHFLLGKNYAREWFVKQCTLLPRNLGLLTYHIS